MVFAHAVEADVTDQHHFVILFREKPLQMGPGVIVQTTKHLGVHPGYAGWGLSQSLAVWIFADGVQDFRDSPLDAGQINFFAQRVRFRRTVKLPVEGADFAIRTRGRFAEGCHHLDLTCRASKASSGSWFSCSPPGASPEEFAQR